MGPHLCFYKYDKDHPELGITPSIPACQIGGRDRLDTTPRELWNYNVLDEEGENKLRGVAEEVKRLVILRQVRTSGSLSVHAASLIFFII